MLSEMTPKEKMRLDTQKGLNWALRELMVLKEQVIKDRSFYNINRMKNRPGICESRFA